MTSPVSPSERRFGLSKSKLTTFEQCSRRLWQQVHAPERAEVDDEQEARMATGHTVGEIACDLWPSGVMVEADKGLGAALTTTRELIEAGHPGPIFEATFEHDGVLIRADILSRDGAGGWHLAEVKSSTSVKDYHLGDLATQVWVLNEAGLKLSGAAIRHIDTSFVLQPEGNFAGLFADADCLADIGAVVRDRTQVVAAARSVLAGDEPVITPGNQCSNPFDCEFWGWCTRDVPAGPEWPVDILPNGGGKRWRAQGVENLLELDESALSVRHAMVLAATRDDIPYHDDEGARSAMKNWGWPRAWLDFETINPGIPRWAGTRPYQQVPFQFSLHLEQKDGTITHHEFLDISGDDPRRLCAEALIAMVPEGATIIAYSAGFERGVLRNLAEVYPELALRLIAMAEATQDLLPVARAHWYHRDQRGSWSIKAVLPTVGVLDYAGMEVKDGAEAQAAYLEAIHPGTETIRKRNLEEGLRVYCERDTWAMIAIARKLAGKP
jgi:hypothetical protein